MMRKEELSTLLLFLGKVIWPKGTAFRNRVEGAVKTGLKGANDKNMEKLVHVSENSGGF